MDSQNAISVEQLGKRYRIGYRRAAYTTLRDVVADRLSRKRSASNLETRAIWALDDVSFNVKPGTALGVIGANGAGKTTLLKVLSRITEPTRGEVRVRGRIGSLLEVGTGFHPELSGRENIFMNGAILGMRRGEIAARFADIVQFAEVERFIDTPVKRYSSGMYVRLAFAVAAHLETDILLVDEVLSVGDFGFQQRCLGKMQEQTSAEGRTVLFVSHNLGSVKALTESCIWLDKGRVRMFGPTDEVFREYILSFQQQGSAGKFDLSTLEQGRPPVVFPHDVAFETLEFVNHLGSTAEAFLEGDPITARVRIRANRAVRDTQLEIIAKVSTLEGVLLFSSPWGPRPVDLDPGLYETSMVLASNPLAAGAYSVQLYMLSVSERQGDKAQDRIPNAGSFRVESNPEMVGELRYARQEDGDILRLTAEWGPLSTVEDGRSEL